MKRLQNFTSRELENIYKNCMNQLAAVRGTPSAEFVIYMLTYYIDAHVKNARGFTHRCQSDYELKRDVEREMVARFGYMPNLIQIFFRMANHLFKQLMDIAEDAYDANKEKLAALYRPPEQAPFFTSLGDATQASTYVQEIQLDPAAKEASGRGGKRKRGEELACTTTTENAQFEDAFK